MTIAKRLYVLMTVPVLLILVLGGVMWRLLDSIETRSGLLTEKVTPGLAQLAHINHDINRLGLSISGNPQAESLGDRAKNRAAFTSARSAISSALDVYAEKFVAEDTDLVITDLQMDETDGFDFLDSLHAVAPNIPVILLTGVLFDPEVIGQTLGGRISSYIEKTAPLERILREVKRQLGN